MGKKNRRSNDTGVNTKAFSRAWNLKIRKKKKQDFVVSTVLFTIVDCLIED